MTLKVQGAGVKSGIEQVIFDVTESWNDFGDGNNANTPGVVQRGRTTQFQGGGLNSSKIFGAVSGALTNAWDNNVGRWLLSYPSAAARAVRLGVSAGPTFPCGPTFSGAQSLPIPFQAPLKRYTILTPVRCAVAGTAVVEIGIATSNGGLTMLGATQAFVWSSDPAVNAGAWLPRYRRINAGPIVNGTNSGVIPTALGWNLLGIRYTEGPVPTIEWLLNGVPRYVISGDANMPVMSAIGSPLLPFNGINTPAGRTLQQAASRFIVEEI